MKTTSNSTTHPASGLDFSLAPSWDPAYEEQEVAKAMKKVLAEAKQQAEKEAKAR